MHHHYPHDWTMPAVYRGQIVLWYEAGVKDDSRACPAIVTVESYASLRLRVFGMDRDFTKECVRHISDPNAKEYDRLAEGAWDYAGSKVTSLVSQPPADDEEKSKTPAKITKASLAEATNAK